MKSVETINHKIATQRRRTCSAHWPHGTKETNWKEQLRSSSGGQLKVMGKSLRTGDLLAGAGAVANSSQEKQSVCVHRLENIERLWGVR